MTAYNARDGKPIRNQNNQSKIRHALKVFTEENSTMRLRSIVFAWLAIGGFSSGAQTSQPANFKDSVTQCDETIRQRLVPSQTQYVAELDAMMKSFQARGELEKMLATKQEKERSMTAGRIEDSNVVQAPIELRNLQLKYKAWQGKLVQQTANEFVVILERQKKKLTIEGKIEEALSVKKDIEKIQQQYGVEGASQDAVVSAPRSLPLLNTPLHRLTVEAFIDGKSVLKVQGGKIWWEHQKDALPGKWDGRNEPTIVNNKKWFPEWDGNQSKPFESSTPFISNALQELRIQKIKCRGSVGISEKPTAANQNTLTVLFDDSKPGGADWYKIEIYW